MNTSVVTTGLDPLTVGSADTFQLYAIKNGIAWDLTGGTITVTLQDPTGAQTVLTATGYNGGATATPWSVAVPTGVWTRSWTVVDASGLKQVSRPIIFAVSTSP